MVGACQWTRDSSRIGGASRQILRLDDGIPRPTTARGVGTGRRARHLRCRSDPARRGGRTMPRQIRPANANEAHRRLRRPRRFHEPRPQTHRGRIRTLGGEGEGPASIGVRALQYRDDRVGILWERTVHGHVSEWRAAFVRSRWRVLRYRGFVEGWMVVSDADGWVPRFGGVGGFRGRGSAACARADGGAAQSVLVEESIHICIE
mmetsp:Transcript_30888/g.64739  ORF Transcript_30888/g.64739 Transcript_30888/m.64739 type:complete len:205 (+) Transcript_30888:772-1386(+)